jgi:hypothetical protein
MRNILILGCGRSGTSTVAGCLAKAGYHMGHTVMPPRLSNPDGMFEDFDVRKVNEEILALVTPQRPLNARGSSVPGQWQRWLASIALDTPLRSTPKIIKRIQDLVKPKPYCFKDPRLCYSLPIWQPFLADARFICVFRHPAITAASILRYAREVDFMLDLDISVDRALEAWRLLNLHVLDKHRHQGDWLFLHWQQVFSEPGRARIKEFTEAPVDENFPKPERQRTFDVFGVPQNVKSVYDKLCELAGFNSDG